jgi:DNA-binding transcriptional MerR regulator
MGGFSLEDLERLLGVSGRTIRYWSYEGLLEGPGAGRGTRYSDEHLARLFLIQKLRAEGRPIAEIKSAIKRLSVADIRALAEQAKAQPPREGVPAKQLIQHWLRDGEPRKALVARESSASALAAASPSPLHGAPEGHWQRISLAPNVELHVQHPLSRTSRELVDQLVALARRLSQEDTR